MALLLIALVVAACGVLAGLAWLGRGVRVDHHRERGVVTAARLVGVLAGIAAAGAVLGLDPGEGGRGAALAPAVFGLVALLFIGAAETIVRPAPVDGLRRAALSSRRVRDYAVRSVAAPVGLAGTCLILVLAFTTLTASADDRGRNGRVFGCSAGDVSATRGPYPGVFYSAPLAVALVLLVALAAAAAHRVVRRPRGYAGGDNAETVLRRRSLTVVLGALLMALCATLAGVALVAGGALRGVAVCAPGWTQPVGDGLLVVAGLAAVGALWGLWTVLAEG